MRILPSKDGWWLIGPSNIAHLPSRAVRAKPKLSLTEEAHAHLRAHGFFEARGEDTYYLTVLTSTHCNLGCGYCFQNTAPADAGSHRPPRIATAHLNDDVIADIARFVGRRMVDGSLSHLHILLFGGEPLVNWKGALRLLDTARGIGLRTADMITNATLLTPTLARRLSDAGLTEAQVTFDGGRVTHDTLRVTRTGMPTFDRIVRNIARAAEVTQLRWSFRINIADPEYCQLEDLLEVLARSVDPARSMIGLHLIDDVGVGFETPVPAWEHVAERFRGWYAAARALGFAVPLPAGAPQCSYCSVRGGATGAVVNADGVLYSCWETAGKPGFEVGDLVDGYLSDNVIDGRWKSCGYAARARWRAKDKRRLLDYVDSTNLDLMLAGQVAAEAGRG